MTEGLADTFDTVAERYEKIRPGYVDKMYADIFRYIPITESSNVVEVGIGGGQATLPFLETGCRLTAVERGSNLTALCRNKFRAYPHFHVATGRFEDFTCADSSYDLVYSASAFHWIEEEIGYPKVLRMLKSGGVFARFANHPYRDQQREELHRAIQAIYAVYMPDSAAPRRYSEEAARERAAIAQQYGFVDTAYHLYHRTRIFTSKAYIALIGTYSDHIALEESKRNRFFAEMERTIDAFGGQIQIEDTIDLQLARKP